MKVVKKYLMTAIISGEVIDENSVYSLEELCEMSGASGEYVIDLVQYGILNPSGENVSQWRFSGDEILRAKRALRLRDDLEINLPGVALVLDLLDELERLKRT